MWLPNDDSNYEKDPINEQSKVKLKLRSSSPPFEGGESLCEFYIDKPHQNEKLSQVHSSRSLPEHYTASSNCQSIVQNDVFKSIGKEKLPSKNFLSLLNRDLLPSNTFTQTFLQSILSSIDSTDPVVANAWMETLLDVIDLLPKEIVKEEILTLAVNKGQICQPVSSRLLCCKMLGKISLKFDSYIVKKEILPAVLSLCQDVDFEVRGFMCRQLDIISKGIGLEATKSAILPELVELANDEEIFVRLAAIETVVQMLPFLDDDTCNQAVIPLVKKLCENSFSLKDSTLPVISKQLGRLCCGLMDNLTSEEKQWFLEFYQQLAKLGLSKKEKDDLNKCTPMPDLLPELEYKDKYRECRYACAFNLPAMVVFVKPENFKSELYSTFKDLCADPFQNVRQTMASSFFEIAKLLNRKSSLLLPELLILLQDDSSEVLKGLIAHLPVCLKAICNGNISEINENRLVKALIACEEVTSMSSNWRLHGDFLSCLSCLPSCISSETIFRSFVPLLFLKLHTARPIPCRISAAYSLLVFLRNTPCLERRKGIINELIRELCSSKSCHKRMLFIRISELIIELFSKVFFKLHFFKPLLTLSADPVPNIRLRLCAILPQLKSLLKLPKDSQLLQKLESCIKTLMINEKDKDVSYAISKAIEDLDQIEVATEPLSQRSSCKDIALDIEDQLKENEERQQLEKEFNSKILHDKKNIIQPEISNNASKSGKIPVRKSGTLPKSSKLKDVGFEKVPAASQSNSLRIIKRERRISTPIMNIDFQKISITPSNKEITPNQMNSIKTSSLKCSVPKSRPHSPSMRIWPHSPNMRTWPRSSSIPKQMSAHCSQHAIIEDNPQKKAETMAQSSKFSPLVRNCKTRERNSMKRYSLNAAFESSRISPSTILSSPELVQKTTTVAHLNIESKIPTSFSKRQSKAK